LVQTAQQAAALPSEVPTSQTLGSNNVQQKTAKKLSLFDDDDDDDDADLFAVGSKTTKPTADNTSKVASTCLPVMSKVPTDQTGIQDSFILYQDSQFQNKDFENCVTKVPRL